MIPDELPIAPRLPLFGIQTIIANKLKLIIVESTEPDRYSQTFLSNRSNKLQHKLYFRKLAARLSARIGIAEVE